MYRCLSFHCVQSQAEAAIEEVCSKLGPLKDECDSVVKDYFPQIWQLLMSQVVSVRVYVPMVLLVGTFFSLSPPLSPSLSPCPSLSLSPPLPLSLRTLTKFVQKWDYVAVLSR